jgi:hypothetical protein
MAAENAVNADGDAASLANAPLRDFGILFS